MGNTVKFEKLPEGKRRLFTNREPVTVDLPKNVQDQFGVKSVTIEPMTHRDASVRERIKAKIESEKAKADHAVGIKQSERSQYYADHLAVYEIVEKANAMLPALPESDDETELESALAELKKIQDSEEHKRAKAEAEQAQIDHLKKYDDLISKVKMRDLSAVYDAEDELHENAYDTVYKYLKKVIAVDGTEESELSKALIHPDFIAWILGEIEDISYLREGEITAFM